MLSRKSSDVDAAIARGHFDVQREQPIERKELAALRQMIETRAVGLGQTILACGAWRGGQRRRLANVGSPPAASSHPPITPARKIRLRSTHSVSS